jgi:hypothetical protein
MLRERTLFDNLGRGEGEGHLPSGSQNLSVEFTREVESWRQRAGVKSQIQQVGVTRGV